MLYTLIGNGNPNKKEVTATLNSLLEADLQLRPDEDFWMIFVDPMEEPSDAYSAAVDWALRRDISFEYVYDGMAYPDWAEEADHLHSVKDPLRFSVKVTRGRPAEGEGKAILLLSDDVDKSIEEHPGLIDVIENSTKYDIPVLHLGGQMVQILLEDEPSPTLERPSPEEFSLKKEAPREEPELDFTREDLESLTRDELKSLVQSRNVVPRDMRSKDALIDAIMGSAPSPTQEDTPASPASFFLLIIDPDGKTEMRPLSAKQAALVA